MSLDRRHLSTNIAYNVLLSLVQECKRSGLTELPIEVLEKVLNQMKG